MHTQYFDKTLKTPSDTINKQAEEICPVKKRGSACLRSKRLVCLSRRPHGGSAAVLQVGAAVFLPAASGSAKIFPRRSAFCKSLLA